MKKTIVLLLATLLLAGCGHEEDTSLIYAAPPATNLEEGEASASLPHDGVVLPDSSGSVVEITEKLFIAQTNDIYLNGEDYVGKTLKYEGLYKNTAKWDNGLEDVVHYVIRYGPGCCGFDGEAGFEIRWDGEYPEIDDWVEVVGTLEEEVYTSGYRLLYINITSLTTKAERGAEFVAT